MTTERDKNPNYSTEERTGQGFWTVIYDDFWHGGWIFVSTDEEEQSR